LKNDFYYKGFWWLPGHQNEEFSGELVIDSSGRLVLKVIESTKFSKNLKELVDNQSMIPLIHGYARDQDTGKDLAFSVFNNFLSSFSIGGLAEYSFQSEFATTYKHFETLDSLTFGGAFLEIQLLNEWTNLTGSRDVKQKTGRKLSFTYEYRQPDPITLYKNKLFHLYLWFYANQKSANNGFELSETVRLNLEFKKPLSYKELGSYIELVQNLMTFCISVPVSVTKVKFHQNTKSQLKKLGQKHQHTFDLIISDNRVFTKQNGMRESHMLLPFSKISSDPQLVIGKWFELTQKYQPVFKLYFDTIYNPSLYKENALLNNVNALEIYHRITNPNFDGKTDQDYQKQLASILSKLSAKNEIEWLTTRLVKKKETHLFVRIKNIAERTPIFSKRILKDIRGFSETVSNTRHFLTHFDPSNKEKGVAEGEQLIELIGKTRLLLQMQLLLDLGLSEVVADECVRRAISNWHSWNR
jgi:hypothetical protein